MGMFLNKFANIFQLPAIFSHTNDEKTLMIKALTDAAAKPFPVKIDLYTSDPTNAAATAKKIHTLIGTEQNPFFYTYEAPQSVVEKFANETVYAAFSCPEIHEEVNYTAYTDEDFELVVVPSTDAGGAVVADTIDVSNLVVFKGPESPSVIEFAVQNKPIFTIKPSTDTAVDPNLTTLTVEKTDPVPTAAGMTYRFVDKDAVTQDVKITIASKYTNTEEVTAEFLDVTLEEIQALIDENMKKIRCGLVGLLKYLRNKCLREKLCEEINCFPKYECGPDKNEEIIHCEKKPEVEKCGEKLIETMCKMEVLSICSSSRYESHPFYSSFIEKCREAIFSCTTVVTLNATIKSQCLLAKAYGMDLGVDFMGMLETGTFYNSFMSDIKLSGSASVCATMELLGYKSLTSVFKKEHHPNDKECIEDTTDAVTDEVTVSETSSSSSGGSSKKKSGNTLLYVGVGVAIVCVASVAVYFVVS